MLLRVALTGNIASGKSTVASVWREEGALIIDADDLSRRVVQPGTPGLAAIVERWGPGIVLPTGELDRSALRDVVFRDPGERQHLERIVHPAVQRLRRLEEERAQREGRSIVVADIPLLYEVGMQDEYDVVVLVDAPEPTRIQRLVEDRGLSVDEARRMIDAQWPSERKRPHADYIIDNTGSVEDLTHRALDVWSLLGRRAAHSR